jgi:heme O synthase-like polyprenyltransferase
MGAPQVATIPSFFLFAVVFMWTPPHFWALVLSAVRIMPALVLMPVVRARRDVALFLHTLSWSRPPSAALFGSGEEPTPSSTAGGLLLFYALRSAAGE